MAECTSNVCCQEIFVGDEDVPLQWHVHTCDTTVDPHVETPKDLTNQLALDIVFLKPDGNLSDPVVGTVAGVPTDGLVQYLSLDTTFDQAGPWKGQLDVTITGEGKKATSIIDFQVSSKLGT